MVDLDSLEDIVTIKVKGLVYTYRECIQQMQRNIKACKEARKKSSQALHDGDTIMAEDFRQSADAYEKDANVWKERAEKIKEGRIRDWLSQRSK